MDNGVQIRYFAAARAAAGIDTANYPAAPLVEILAEAGKSNPKLAHVIGQCSFLVDALAVHDQNIVIKNGSVIDVLPRFAGG